MFAMPIDPNGSCEEGSVGDGRWADSNLVEIPWLLDLTQTCFQHVLLDVVRPHFRSGFFLFL